MPDIERVLKGLEAHAVAAGCSDNCPYWGRKLNCSEELAADAFALLKAQQPRVLAVDEAMNKDCWYESKQGSSVRYAIIKYIDEMHVEIKSCNEDYSVYRLTDGYGKYWRCWNKRPTDEQRREVKWVG